MTSSGEADPRLVRIAERLLLKTKRREIKWDSINFGSDEQLDYSTERMTVSLTSSGPRGSGVVTMAIKNSEGIELERLVSNVILGMPSGLLPDLYVAARRHALDVDAQIDDLARSLGVDDEPDESESI